MDGLCFAGELNCANIFNRDAVAQTLLRGLVNQNRLADDFGVRFEPRGEIDRIADTGVGRAALRAGIARDHLPRRDRDADANRRAQSSSANYRSTALCATRTASCR